MYADQSQRVYDTTDGSVQQIIFRSHRLLIKVDSDLIRIYSVSAGPRWQLHNLLRFHIHLYQNLKITWKYIHVTYRFSLSPITSGGVLLYSHHSFASSEAIGVGGGLHHRSFTSSEAIGERTKCDDDCHSYLSRLDGYCHQSLFNVSRQQSLAREGRLDGNKDIADQFELVHAHVVIRHGDRTPVYTYKIGSTVFYECGLIDTQLNWDGLRDFPRVVSLQPSAKIQTRFLKLHPGIYTRRCGVGMLTQLGFKQHRSLGSLLQTRYAPLLGNFTSTHFSSRDLFVHSTDMPRTLQSAAAFLVGFLPNKTSIRRATQIHVCPGTINHKPPPGIEKVYRGCRGYYDILDAELKKTMYYNTEKMVFHPLLERLCQMFHIPNPNQPIVNRLFDHFMTRGCHNRDDPLPCYRDQCIDFSYALKLFDFSDWSWSHKNPTNSSILRLLPFLRHSVLETMMKVTQVKTNTAEDPYSFKFMLTLTHDDTITIMLNVLGYHLDRWIPYASRVVFELWRRKSSSEHYVRVLFNGETISDKTIPGKVSSLNEELIRFDRWRDFLTTGNFKDVTTYNKVCGNN